MPEATKVVLSANRYGKDKVRVFRVVRSNVPGGKQQVYEYNVRLMIEGDFAQRYAFVSRILLPIKTTIGEILSSYLLVVCMCQSSDAHSFLCCVLLRP